MSTFTPPSDIRNIVLTGHAGSGKTTLVERLLFDTKAVSRLGTVEEGNTTSDHTTEEKQHKHSLFSSLMHFRFHGHLVNLIDTPGLGDFLGQSIAAMPACETVAVVVDAVKGIEPVTRRMMNLAADRKIPRMIIVNKIDAPEASPERLTAQLREAFGPVCLPINLPTNGGKSVVNVFDHDGTDAAGDAADFSSVAEAHRAIIEQIVEVEERLMETYLEKGEAFSPEDLHGAFEKCLGEAHLVPICFVSARTGAGVDDLLHIFADLCPAPTEVNPPEFVYRPISPAGDAGDEQEFNPNPDPAGKTIAHVFKVTTDPFVGKLAFFRVHSGVVRTKDELLLNDHKKPLRMGHLLKVQGKEMTEVHELGPGDIGAVSKIDEIQFNGVLHDSHEHDSVHLKPLALPRPLYGLAVELKNHADEAKFATGCHKLSEEDPCFRMERIPATKQTVISGLGELHLRVVLERLKHNFNIDLITSKPKVAYKETITARADGHHRHKKQTGGAGQFGEVYLRVEPLPADHETGFEFVSEVVGGTVPRQYWPAVEKGVRMILSEGAIAGYPLTGVRVALYDGKYHDVDSKEVAFVTAGKKAFIDAVRKARPALLEPIVTLEISAPAKFVGDVNGMLSTKRGRVQDTIMDDNDIAVITAQAPLAELSNFANELKSLTAGQGSFSMDYSHDEHTPANIQAAVVAAYKPHPDED
ncbi:MAG: elongation factor G [Phycisphaerae bacterium]|nr:elongation factor G [Phycisphaerae bacterium]